MTGEFLVYKGRSSPFGDKDLFPGGPLTKINKFEITDLRMLHPCVPLNPGKIVAQHILFFFFGVQMSSNRKIFFMGGEFPRTYMHLKPKEKMTHDCLRWYFFHKVGSKDVFALDLHRSDIRTGIYSSTFLDTDSWISVCNEVTLPISIRTGTIISPAALIIFFPGAQVQTFRKLLEVEKRTPWNACKTEDALALAKEYKDICSASPTKTVT